MSFSQALSGLNAARNQLGVLGNNIANSQTTGFKSSSVQFADVYANSKVGLGVQASGVLQDFSEGNLERTDRNLDLAIGGEGFLRFQQNGQVVYSRNGQLSLTKDGQLVNAQGAQLMGYGLTQPGDAFSGVSAAGQTTTLKVPTDDLEAAATNRVEAGYNLDATVDPSDTTQLSQARLVDENGADANIEYHYSSNFTVYDSVGNPRNAAVYFTKQDPANGGAVNTWNAKIAMDGVYIGDPATSGNNNDFTVNFASNGTLMDVIQNGASVLANGPQLTFTSEQLGLGEGAIDNLTFNLNLEGSSQYARESGVGSLAQNGYTAGSLLGISIREDGTVMREFSNEQSRAAGQIVLVNFRNVEGLKPQGDNAWSATPESGQELIGVAGSGIFGTIESGTLETSNVDMARELVDMIVAQRAYQANSQTIKTQDEILQTAINLR